MKIYLACALTLATPEHKALMDQLRSRLKKDFEVLDFFGLKSGQATEVYQYDKNCIDKCDLVIAECSEQSLGVGYEIGYALSTSKKVLAFAREGLTVGRMVRGITDPNFNFQFYSNPEEIINSVKQLV